jgi:hypothetical protein
MRALTAFILLALAALSPAAAQDRTYGGYGCTFACSGHLAGYKWAQQHAVSDPDECPLRIHSPSFQEGCMAYAASNAQSNPDEDDDGDMIGRSPHDK